MQRTIGFIGLGNMGRGMARRLLGAGSPLVVYDVAAEAMARLTAEGATAAASPAEVGATAEIVFVMVLNYAQAEQVVLGEQGVAGAMQPGGVVVVSSTIAPSQAMALRDAVAAKGLRYIDAPVSGGFVRAADGTMTMMVGAEPDDFERVKPLLERLAANLFYCGAVGLGQTAKMCNQLMAGVTFMASAECLALGAAAGIDTKLLVDIISSGAGDCWMLRNRGVRMLDTYETGSRLDTFAKDLGIVLQAADEHHLPLFIATAARQWITLGIANGYGAQDDAHVIKLLESFTGASVKDAAGKSADAAPRDA